jgi:hypothetical protein
MALNNSDFLNNLWKRHVNAHSVSTWSEDWSWLEKAKELPSAESLRVSEWSEDFFGKALHIGGLFSVMSPESIGRVRTLLQNRMVMGAFRHGMLAGNHHEEYDHIKSVTDRLAIAQKSKTWEPLLDCFNMYFLAYRLQTTPATKLEMVINAASMLWYIADVIDLENWSLGSVDDGVHTRKR